MKVAVKLLFFLLVYISGLRAQTPQSFKCHAFVRDTTGSIIANQLVSFKTSLLSGSENGAVAYAEIHTDSTNQFGLITIDIGRGIVESGNFSSLNWTADKYFLRLEVDIAGGTNYVFMGASQLLSVPYSLHSQTSERLPLFSSEQRDTMSNIPMGKSFFNTTTNRINYYEGTHWYEIRGTCLPQPTTPDAGPDQLNIQGATATLNGNVPTSGSGVWKIVSGNGGYLSDSLNPTSQFFGFSGITYVLNWRISNSCGYLEDAVTISFAPYNCGTAFLDTRDNQVYNTVLIGSRCWIRENMNIGTMINGEITMLNNGILEKYCSGNLESNCVEYGGLYQWNEMMQYSTTQGVQGICPTGWHIPTDDEWKILEGSIDSQYGIGDPEWDLEGDRGLDAGGKLKEAGTFHWAFPNTGATNSSGFTALPGGARNTDGTFPSFLISGRFWSSTESDSDAYRRVLSTTLMNISRNAANKNFGLSVRCIKD